MKCSCYPAQVLLFVVGHVCHSLASCFTMATPSEKINFEAKQEPILRDPSVKLGSISDDDREVFKANVNGVEFRTVTWQRAIIIFVKTQIAIGVLRIPSAFHSLGAVGSGLCIVGFQALNCCLSLTPTKR